MGGPSSSGQTSTTSQLYSWRDILPPWTQVGQQAILPKLFERFEAGGLTPEQERTLMGAQRASIEDATSTARKNLISRLSSQGISGASPLAAGEFSNIESDRITGIQRAAADLAKLKVGALDTATQHLLSGLYAPPPSAVGTTSYGTQRSSGGK